MQRYPQGSPQKRVPLLSFVPDRFASRRKISCRYSARGLNQNRRERVIEDAVTGTHAGSSTNKARTMKRILPLVALAALFFASCTTPGDPNPTYKSRGEITGPDYRRCAHPCCGGWWIEIEGENHRFFELPPGSAIKLSETTFPIPVKLSWSRKSTDSTWCENDVILIHAIERE